MISRILLKQDQIFSNPILSQCDSKVFQQFTTQNLTTSTIEKSFNQFQNNNLDAFDFWSIISQKEKNLIAKKFQDIERIKPLKFTNQDEFIKKDIINWINNLSDSEKFQLFIIENDQLTAMILKMQQQQNKGENSFSYLKNHLKFDFIQIVQAELENLYYSRQDQQKTELKTKTEDILNQNLRFISNYQIYDGICFEKNFVKDTDNLINYFNIITDNCIFNIKVNQDEKFEFLQKSIWFNPISFHSIIDWIVNFYEKSILTKFLNQKQFKTFQTSNIINVESFLNRFEKTQKSWQQFDFQKKQKIINQSIKIFYNNEQTYRDQVVLKQLIDIQDIDQVQIRKFYQNFDDDIIEYIYFTEFINAFSMKSFINRIIINQIEEINIEKFAQQLIKQEEKKKKSKKTITQNYTETTKTKDNSPICNKQNNQQLVIDTQPIRYENDKLNLKDFILVQKKKKSIFNSPQFVQKTEKYKKQQIQTTDLEIKENRLKSVEKFKQQNFNQAVKNYSNFLQNQVKKQHSIRNLIIKRVQYYSKNAFQDNFIDIQPFGSYVNNLHLYESDLDLQIFNLKSQSIQQSLRYLLEYFKQLSFVILFMDITTAQTPVIKLVMDASIDVQEQDLNLKQIDKNLQSQINVDIIIKQEEIIPSIDQVSIWLNQFSSLRIMTLILKQFLYNRNNNISYQGGISSFTLIIMIISYLKNRSSQKSKDYYQLLKGFLKFYGQEFNHETTQIDYNQQECFIQKTDMEKALQIMDPLNQINITKNVYKIKKIQQDFQWLLNQFIQEEQHYQQNIAFIQVIIQDSKIKY